MRVRARGGGSRATGITDSMKKQMMEQGEKMKMKGTGRPAGIPKAKSAPADAAFLPPKPTDAAK